MVITRYHIGQVLTGRGRSVIVILLMASAGFHLLFLGAIYLLANERLLSYFQVPMSKLPKVAPPFFLNAFIPQGFILGLLTLIVGAGLIANDRRSNALPLYLARPLSPTEYIVGKLGVVVAFALAVTAIPINLLFVFELLIHGGWSFLQAYWWLPFSIPGYSVVIGLVCGATMLLASSLVKRAALGGVIAICLFIAHTVFTGFLVTIFQNDRLLMFQLVADLHQFGIWLFRLSGPPYEYMYPFSARDAAIIIGGALVLCLAIVRWRIRAVEVVK
jgi:ABC-type transport system involved in multi-copper enzyme maturation permease subunit